MISLLYKQRLNLFCNFWAFLQVSTNFGSLKQFLEFKITENELKFAALCQAEIGPWLQCTAQRPAMRGWTDGRLGHGLAARSSRECGPARRRGHHAQAARGAACLPVARWRLAGGKVLS
jgi:hypothetical protein